MVPGEAHGPPGNVLWDCNGVGLQGVGETTQVGISKDLRVQVHVRNGFSGSSAQNVPTLLEGLQHRTHQSVRKGNRFCEVGP